MRKLLASEAIEIDQKFLDELKVKIADEYKKMKEEEDKIEKFYTIKQVADYTKRSKQTVRRHIKEGILQAEKIGKNWLISEDFYKTYINRKND